MVIGLKLSTNYTRNSVLIYPPFALTSTHSCSPGTFVRLAPNHVSISDPDALQTVYAHGNGSQKSDFYDAFVSIERGLFNTRIRSDHARKRKIVSHIFSQKSVLEFEPNVREYVGQLIGKWDQLCEGSVKGLKGDEGDGWLGRDGRLWLDCLPCKPRFLHSYSRSVTTCHRVQLFSI